MIKIIKTSQIRLFPTTEQIDQLNELSVSRNILYNKILQTQIDEYENNKRIKSEFDLNKLETVWRKDENSGFSKLNSKACQAVAKQVFGSYRSFFNLIKKDHTVRPPKLIENVNQFHSIVYNQSGWSFKDNNILILNGIKLRYSGIINNLKDLTIKEVKLKFINNKWLLDLSIETELNFENALTVNNKILAIDLGLKTLATGIDTDGNMIIIPNKSYKINKYFSKQINKVKCKQSKTIKYSLRYKKLQKTKSNLYSKKNSQIKQTLHIQSKQLSDMNYKTIVVGDLKVKSLISKHGTNSGFKKKSTRKSFNDSNVSMFINFLSRKCQEKNIEVLKINEAWTSQMNCLTGKMFSKKLELYDREVSLNESIVIDRDLNAAINIYMRYETNHLALVNEPLNIFSVVNKYNLLAKSSD